MAKEISSNIDEVFLALLANLSDPALLIECHTYRILKVNEAALSIYGYIHQKDLKHKSFFDLFAEPSLQTKSCQGTTVLMEGVPFLRNNGEIFYGDIHGYMVPGQVGPHPLYLVLIKNINREQESVYQSAIWQSVLHHIPLLLWVKDIHGHYCEVNENFLRLHSFRREEVIGRTDFDLFPMEYAQACQNEDQCVIYSRAKIHKEDVFIKDKKELWYETYKIPIINSRDEIVGIAGFSLNINERKELDKQIKAKQEWLETTLRSIGEAVITVDMKGVITSLNPIAETYIGIRQSQAIGHPLSEIVFIRNPVDNQIENPFLLLQSRGATSVYQKDRLLLNAQGIEIPIEYKISPILTQDGYLTNNGFVLILTNVSHHKMREQHLLAENELMKEFLEASPNPIFFTDKEGKITRANEEFLRLVGYESQHLKHKTFWSLFHADDEAHLKKEFEGLAQHIKIKNHIFVLLDQKGNPHHVELSANYVKTSREEQFLFILNDVSERMNHMHLLYKQQTSLQLMEEILQILGENPQNLSLVCQKIALFMDIQRLFVYRWLDHTQQLDPLYLWSHTHDAPPVPTLESRHFSQDWIGLLLYQQYLILTEKTPFNAYEKKAFEKTGLGSILFLPLYFHGTLWGILGVHDLLNPDREWDETQLAFFKAVAPLFIPATSFHSK
ncbi:MAG: PAS domain S-box protein [Brevinematales bacterium]|nr:PAS domain S-box protein [Brevinematales bacterium]